MAPGNRRQATTGAGRRAEAYLDDVLGCHIDVGIRAHNADYTIGAKQQTERGSGREHTLTMFLAARSMSAAAHTMQTYNCCQATG